MDVRDISGIVQESIINLESYGNNDHHIKLPIALREAKMYLDDITHRSANLPKGQESLRCANDQFEFWSEELTAANEQKRKLHDYLKSRAIFNERLDDLKNLTHRTFRDSSETEAFVTKSRKSLEKLKLKANEIKTESEEVEEMLNNEVIAQGSSLMESLNDNLAKLKVEHDDLIILTEEVDTTISERIDELDGIKKTLIPDAQKHAADLSQRSKTIVDMFQQSKDGASSAMAAGTAHKNISDAINSARVAADSAYDAATFSNDKLNPIDPEEETMIEKGRDLSVESEDIQRDAEEQISKIKGKLHFFLSHISISKRASRDSLQFNFLELKKMLDYQQGIVQNMSNQIRQSGKTNNELSALITKLSNSDTRKIVQDSAIVADEILEDMNNIGKEAMDIGNNVNNLKSRLDELDPEWDSKYGLAEENLVKSQSNIRLANNTWHANEPVIRQQNEKFQAWNESFSLKLQELRDKIAQAKHAAEGVRTSNYLDQHEF